MLTFCNYRYKLFNLSIPLSSFQIVLSYHVHLVSFDFALVDNHFTIGLLFVLNQHFAVALVSALYQFELRKNKRMT